MSPKKIYLEAIATNTFTCTTAGRISIREISNLSSKAELLASDGKSPQIKRWRTLLNIISSREDEAVAFTVIPIIVQTNGTLTEQVDLDYNLIDEALAAQIDDEFGFQVIGEAKISSITKSGPAGTVNMSKQARLTLTLPKNVINLLNKEVNTERLQDLLLVLIFNNCDSNDNIRVSGHRVVEFLERSKGITIR